MIINNRKVVELAFADMAFSDQTKHQLVAPLRNAASIIVMGHPQYYSKFGFQPSSLWGIKAPFEVEDEVFMALELQEQALEEVSGVVEYSSVFFK